MPRQGGKEGALLESGVGGFRARSRQGLGAKPQRPRKAPWFLRHGSREAELAGQVVTGSCLCGAVAYEVRLPFARFVECHCSRYRKASGSSHAANAVVAPEAFRWTRGAEGVVRYDLPAARSFSVAFCSVCGSQLPHATRSGREVIVPCGGLDGDPGEKPSARVQWSSRAAWTGGGGALPTSD